MIGLLNNMFQCRYDSSNVRYHLGLWIAKQEKSMMLSKLQMVGWNLLLRPLVTCNWKRYLQFENSVDIKNMIQKAWKTSHAAILFIYEICEITLRTYYSEETSPFKILLTDSVSSLKKSCDVQIRLMFSFLIIFSASR